MLREHGVIPAPAAVLVEARDARVVVRRAERGTEEKDGLPLPALRNHLDVVREEIAEARVESRLAGDHLEDVVMRQHGARLGIRARDEGDLAIVGVELPVAQLDPHDTHPRVLGVGTDEAQAARNPGIHVAVHIEHGRLLLLLGGRATLLPKLVVHRRTPLDMLRMAQLVLKKRICERTFRTKKF